VCGKAVAEEENGKAIKSILGKASQQHDMHSLTLPNGEFIIEPKAVHDTNVQHLNDLMHGNGIETIFDQHTID